MAWCAGTHRDTWIWIGSSWRNVTVTGTGPEARFGATLTYDDKAKALVLFGGGTWVVSPTNSPPVPRGSQRCLHEIFHMKNLGTGQYLNFYCFNDTWYLKSVAGNWVWEEKTVASAARPPARHEHFAAMDSAGQTVIGLGCTKKGPLRHGADDQNPDAYYFDCWHRELNNQNNLDSRGYVRDAWRWNHATSAWSQFGRDSTNIDNHCRYDQEWLPHCRLGSTATLDRLSGRIFVYGGFFMEHDWNTGYAYNTQVFPNDHAWGLASDWIRTCLQSDPQCSMSPYQPGTPGRRAWSSSATAWIENGWKAVVFGGEGNVVISNGVSQHYDDLWIWQWSMLPDTPQKGYWTSLCGTGCARPGVRRLSGMAYRTGLAGELVLFGGKSQSGSPLDDTWTFPAASPAGITICESCIAT